MGQIVPQAATVLSAGTPATTLATGAEAHQVLTFTLGGELFAIGILNVKEIIEYGQVTEIPMMPSFIRGVINLRGAVVPVIDLSARFGGSQSAVGKRTCIVIVETPTGEEGQRQDIGVVVDAVSEVLDIPPGDVEPPPAFGARLRTDFIAGMGRVAGRFVIILDVTKVLSVDELALLSNLDGAAASTAQHPGHDG